MNEKRGIFDYIGDQERTKSWTERGYNLIIDKRAMNPIDVLFREQLQVHYWVGIPFSPRMISGWYVLAVNGNKKVEGKIVDIYPSRDLLIKTVHNLNVCVPFEHVKVLRRNKL